MLTVRAKKKFAKELTSIADSLGMTRSKLIRTTLGLLIKEKEFNKQWSKKN